MMELKNWRALFNSTKMFSKNLQRPLVQRRRRQVPTNANLKIRLRRRRPRNCPKFTEKEKVKNIQAKRNPKRRTKKFKVRNRREAKKRRMMFKLSSLLQRKSPPLPRKCGLKKRKRKKIFRKRHQIKESPCEERNRRKCCPNRKPKKLKSEDWICRRRM